MMDYWHEYYSPEPNTGCWLWDCTVDKDGYGKLRLGGKNWRAHRYSYTREYGEIPEGMLVCHSCDEPSCVNPAHLFLGSEMDNIRDSKMKGRHSSDVLSAMTHCIWGHPFSEENTYRWKNKRMCRECRRITEMKRIR